ncbi:MAG TPA: hypothetical protein ENM97_01110 [Moorella mulderi]|nr:hypothetical protein [Moorella mulderi]
MSRVDLTPLVKRIQEGDWQAFEVLVEQYSGKALRTAYFITGSQGMAEDAVQEAFVQCYRKIKGLRDPASFEAWFSRLLTRICWRLPSREKGLFPSSPSSRGVKNMLLVTTL